MAEQGEEKLIEVARHIARTLGRTDTMADDILQIFSNFDGRFSREKLAAERRSDGSSSDEHPPPSDSSIDRRVRSLDRQISRFLNSDRSIWSDSTDAADFLVAVDALVACVRGVDQLAPGDRPVADSTDDLLHQCMLRMEDEFRSLIENPYGASPYDPRPGFYSDGEDSDGDEDLIPVAPPLTDYDFIIDALPSGSVADLHEIAKRMVGAGFGRECAHAYGLARRDFLEESVSRLGIRHRDAAGAGGDEVQTAPWPALEDEICRWVKAVNVAFRILFPSERRLCLRVFSGLSAIADLSFAEACRGPALQLLRFAEAIASGSRSPERLFRVVDMYETLRDVIPELDGLFSDQYSAFLSAEAVTVREKLGKAIRGIFTELENLIRRDPAKAAVPGGGLHPITRYVMNYLRAACSSRETLEEVMDEDGVGTAASLGRPSSPLASQIAWILEVLQGNLESKAKIYREPALCCIFLMNNGRYMMQKVRDSSDLAILIGEEWMRRQAARERQWAAEYQKITWSKVTAVLRIDGGPPPPTPPAMCERLKVFDVYLEETCRARAAWIITDDSLRAELRAASSAIVLPAYRRFLAVYREKNVRHSPQEVEARISELFEGSRKP
ncbi:hypothetical protein AXF42_Ash013711 [Apostasia shenzhenica]|uniref:Exocyst subunit Exo70 family protein n=1 Tax=Apostasia shenzhenica TaxID=1088818 RepID=A0A2I0A4M7_9ASPA|nr:hypothetical protein AXF42_Ash013711 [Apostasia shenzhenica]